MTQAPPDPRTLAHAVAAASSPGVLTVLDLGVGLPFAPLAEAQAEYLELRRREPSRAHDVLLLLEHRAVFTVSRRAAHRHLVWSSEERERQGVELAQVDRGGDVTYHGPGQLVGYPLLDLAPLGLGSSAYMQRLEMALIRSLAEFGLTAHIEQGMPGVWVPSPQDGHPAQKLCAIGTRVSRGLTKHGFALNHTVKLSHFRGIIPCGLDRPVTSLAALLGEHTPSRQTVREQVARHLAQCLQREHRWAAVALDATRTPEA